MHRTFYIHILGKKKKVNWTSCRGTCSVLQQRDSPLNSLMIVLQVEKKARKIFSKGPVVMQHAKRGQRNFPSVIKIHNCAPSQLGMQASCDGQLAEKLNTCISSAGFCWQLEKQQRFCACLSMRMFSNVHFLSKKDVKTKHIHVFLWVYHFLFLG